MTEVEVTKKKTETVIVDVDFPVFRSHCGRVTKIMEDGTAITIGVDEDPRNDGNKYTVEIRDDYDFTESSGMDYHLGKGMYRASEATFEKKLDKVNETLREVVRKHD